VEGTPINFSIWYIDADNEAPVFVQLLIDNSMYNMTRATGQVLNFTKGVKYITSRILEVGFHDVTFVASDGTGTTDAIFRYQDKIEVVHSPIKSTRKDVQNTPVLMTGILVIIIIIAITVTVFYFYKKK